MLAQLACAAHPSAGPDLASLRAELTAVREDNLQLERRLDRLEARESVSAGRGAIGSPSTGEERELPTLTVVKLKPRSEPAPRIETRLEVVEPPPEQLEALSAALAAKANAPEREENLDPAIGDAMFENGLQALKTGNLLGGVEKLQRFAADNPRHTKADNALYFSGVGLIGLQNDSEAARAFEALIATYPAGDAVADALLKLGECRTRLNQPAEARAAFSKLMGSYPGTAAAAQAQHRLAAIHGTVTARSP